MEFCPGGTLAKFVGTKTMQKETGPPVSLENPRAKHRNLGAVMQTSWKHKDSKPPVQDDLGLWTVGLDVDLFAKYAWQMLSGTAYLHYCKIVHRDIKLENYMRVGDEEDAQLKLIDMGLWLMVSDIFLVAVPQYIW